MNKKSIFPRLLGLGLAAAMVLGGCGEPAAPKNTPSPAPTAAPTATPEPESPNFYKYNTYLEALEYLYDNVDYLDHYFAVVAYQEEFAVLDGGEYGDLQISVGVAVGDYLNRLDTCLELAEEEPSYPEMDAAMKALVPLAKENEEALLAIASYARSGDWREDNLAKAAQLHTALLPTIEPFFAALAEAQAELDLLDESFQDGELSRMRENGEMIAYYTNILLNDTVDFYTLACAEGNISGEQIIPMNMDELSAAAAQVKATGELLLEALEDKAERGRTVKLDYMNEDDLKYQYYRFYQTHVNGVLYYVEEAMTYAGQGGDISGSLEFVEMNYSGLISDYNDCIVG